ncbi:head-to-tail connector protein [Mycobacterium phage Mabel]|nr:head-to-tail connector protein [Mycobacterium phage Mabel]
MATVYANANQAAARHKDTKRAVRRVNRDVSGRARANLAAANATSRITPEGYFPAEIETAEHDVDCYTILHAPDAMALEFGHAPSGVFDPAVYGRETKAPDPTYILTRAAYGGHTTT